MGAEPPVTSRWVRGATVWLAPSDQHGDLVTILRPHHVRVSAVLLMLAVVVGLPASGAGASGGSYNPSANIAPVPDYEQVSGCFTSGPCASNPCLTFTLPSPPQQTLACALFIVPAIDAARAKLGQGRLILPDNWAQLTVPEQIFVIVNLERISVGQPPLVGLNTALDQVATAGAVAGHDPVPDYADPAFDPTAIGGAYAYGAPSVLAADYEWMYRDGWDSTPGDVRNADCTSAGAPGCWAHRDELLGFPNALNNGIGLNCSNCEAGAGYSTINGVASYAIIVERPAAGQSPPLTFTWASVASHIGTSNPSLPSGNPTGTHHSAPGLHITRSTHEHHVITITWTARALGGGATLRLFRGTRCSGSPVRVETIVIRPSQTTRLRGDFPAGPYRVTIEKTPTTTGCQPVT